MWKPSLSGKVKKVGMFMCLLFSLTTVETAPAGEEKRLGVDFDVTFASQYMWRGYAVFGKHAAIQPSVNLDLIQTGFSINVWGSFALSSGYEELDEYDYTLSWGKTFLDDKLDFCLNYIYYDFPNVSSESADTQEWGMSIALPDLLHLGPGSLVPSWYCGYLWAVDSEGPEEGWFNIFGLSYAVPFQPLLLDQKEQALNLAFELTHNDGAFDADSGLSHSVLSLSTTFEIAGLALTPGINYQWSFEDTVDDDDECWSGISVTYSF